VRKRKHPHQPNIILLVEFYIVIHASVTQQACAWIILSNYSNITIAVFPLNPYVITI